MKREEVLYVLGYSETSRSKTLFIGVPIIEKIFADFKVELEDAKAQGFREAIKEMGKVKGA